jgi:methylthioribose-1-phosphate isomerase
MIAETVKWVGDVDGVLEMIDQRRLPTEYVMLRVRSVEQLHEAIRTLAVRGAPAIGVAAGYGPVLALQWLDGGKSLREALDHAVKACEYLATSRPTAVNLFWALDRVRSKAQEVAAEPGATPQRLAEALLAEANAIWAEDVEMCRRIGENGEKFIRDGFGVLTHCNAGALATAGQGTALSVMFEAQKKGRRFEVYADETRPLLQGSRLTAWELQRAGIKVTVICDNMAGFLMKQGRIQAVITGADRIETGAQIPIEERNATEVTWIGGTHLAPEGVGVYNPAFDVTPAQNIAAIITEKGVIEGPNPDRIRKLLG